MIKVRLCCSDSAEGLGELSSSVYSGCQVIFTSDPRLSQVSARTVRVRYPPAAPVSAGVNGDFAWLSIGQCGSGASLQQLILLLQDGQ